MIYSGYHKEKSFFFFQFLEGIDVQQVFKKLSKVFLEYLVAKMGDSGEASSSEAPRHEDVAHPKQGFDELPVDYGMMLILCWYEVHTMPSCCTILVLFLNKLDTILNTKTVLFMYDYSTISFHMMPVQFMYNACTIS